MFSSGANDRRGNELPDVLKLSSIPYGVPRLRANSNSAKYSLCKIDHSYKPSIKRVCSGCTRGCTPLRVHAPSSSGTEGRGEGMQTLKNGSVYPHSDRIRLGILENLYRFMPTISGRGRGWDSETSVWSTLTASPSSIYYKDRSAPRDALSIRREAGFDGSKTTRWYNSASSIASFISFASSPPSLLFHLLSRHYYTNRNYSRRVIQRNCTPRLLSM